MKSQKAVFQGSWFPFPLEDRVLAVLCFTAVDAFVAPSPATTASPAKVDSSGVIDLFGGAYLSSVNTYRSFFIP